MPSGNNQSSPTLGFTSSLLSNNQIHGESESSDEEQITKGKISFFFPLIFFLFETKETKENILSNNNSFSCIVQKKKGKLFFISMT